MKQNLLFFSTIFTILTDKKCCTFLFLGMLSCYRPCLECFTNKPTTPLPHPTHSLSFSQFFSFFLFFFCDGEWIRNLCIVRWKKLQSIRYLLCKSYTSKHRGLNSNKTFISHTFSLSQEFDRGLVGCSGSGSLMYLYLRCQLEMLSSQGLVDLKAPVPGWHTLWLTGKSIVHVGRKPQSPDLWISP